MTPILRKHQTFRIAMIGAGKVGSQLAPALEDAGHHIEVVFSRGRKRAVLLADRLYAARATDQLDFSESEAEVFIISVKDDAIPEVASRIRLPEGALLLHTAGGRPLEDLKAAHAAAIGILYPLQTFSDEHQVDFRKIPLLIEADQKKTLKIVRNIAESIGKQVEEIDSERRAMIHVSAIFACNFSNHMMHIAQHLMEQNGLKYDWLHPLIHDTFDKALRIGPAQTQTGPASRNDQRTMQKHLEHLADEKDLAQMYRTISQSIRDFHR